MSCYVGDQEIEEFVPTRYWEQEREGWNKLTDTEKARALAKKVIYNLKLIKQWVYEVIDYVSLTRAIDIFWEESEKEGFLERNSWNEKIYRRKKK